MFTKQKRKMRQHLPFFYAFFQRIILLLHQYDIRSFLHYIPFNS